MLLSLSVDKFLHSQAAAYLGFNTSFKLS